MKWNKLAVGDSARRPKLARRVEFLGVVLLALSLAPDAMAQLLNPGFEADAAGSTNITDWITDGDTTNRIVGGGSFTGDHSVAIGVRDGGTLFGIRSSHGIPISANRYMHATAYVRGTNGIPYLGFAIGSTTSGYSGYMLAPVTTSWTKFSYSVKANLAGTAYLRVLGKSTTGPVTLFWDDVNIYTNNYPSDDTGAPYPPGPVIATDATATSVALSWEASAGDTDVPDLTSGFLGYLVVRDTTVPSTPPVSGVAYKPEYNTVLGSGTVVYRGSATSFSDTGLTNGTAYQYRVYAADNALNYSVAAVLQLNRLPVGVADELSTRTNLAVSVSAAKLLANDSDPDGDTLTLTEVGSALPTGSTVTLSGGGVTYQPAADYAGTGSFSYVVSDGRGGAATVQVTVTVKDGATGGMSANVVGDPWIDGTTHEFVVRFAGIPGETYTVEWSDAASGPWHKLENRLVSAEDAGFGVGVFEVRQATDGVTSRFYRTAWPGY